MSERIIHFLSKQHLRVAAITNDNLFVVLNLFQAYEAEFSSLTQKMPNKEGVFQLDITPLVDNAGYLLYQNDIPIGFTFIDITKIPYDVEEFYIIPITRGNGFGKLLAHYIFDMHPGPWQIRQISGANLAREFWRKTISYYIGEDFKEEITEDPKWGEVTRQSFVSRDLVDMTNLSWG
ncbi:MAG: hypothetical protein P8P83_03820 [Rickettsiaceae bacterium]|nr:hypothetical protein [Rickettsiaceae bacterium]